MFTFATIRKHLNFSGNIGAHMGFLRLALGAAPATSFRFVSEPLEYQMAACIAIQQIGE
jgi:hypothetical protein